MAAALSVTGAVFPAPASAADLFPVDDWLGAGIKQAGDVVLGPLKLGVKEIAQLLATIVGALADLLIPKSLVRSGLDGIEWLVQLPLVGVDSTSVQGAPAVHMPHLVELRDVMTWIGVTLLPLGLVLGAGRAFFAPTADGDTPSELLGRTLTAALGLLVYDWAWSAVSKLSRLLTGALLGLPWVADGVERMLETLVIGGAAGSAVAAEFVVPLMVLIAGTVLLGLLLVRVGLEVATALLYVFGGLALGISITGLGRRLFVGWLMAAGALLMLPLLWSTVFAVGAALMLDARDTSGKGDLSSFVAQLYNVAAALAVFWISIKLALGVFKHASGAITGITATPAASSATHGRGGAGGAGRLAALAQNATPAGLARFSTGLRGSLQSAASYPVRHPVRTAQGAGYSLRHPVQATRDAASGLASALANSSARGRHATQRAASWDREERGTGRVPAAGSRAGENGPRNGTRPVPSSTRGDSAPRTAEPQAHAVRAATPRGASATDAPAPSNSSPPRPAPPPVPQPLPRPPASSPGPLPPASASTASPTPGEPATRPGSDVGHPPSGSVPRPPDTTRPVWLMRPRREDADRDGKDSK